MRKRKHSLWYLKVCRRGEVGPVTASCSRASTSALRSTSRAFSLAASFHDRTSFFKRARGANLSVRRVRMHHLLALCSQRHPKT